MELSTIYIVIVEDRHTDIKVYPYISPLAAIQRAKDIASEQCSHQEDYEEHDYGRDDGWIFYADYSCEGDNVKVVTAKVEG